MFSFTPVWIVNILKSHLSPIFRLVTAIGCIPGSCQTVNQLINNCTFKLQDLNIFAAL